MAALNNPPMTMFFTWFCLVLLTFFSHPVESAAALDNAQSDIGRNITHILDTILTADYDKRVRPNYAGPPVGVGVTMSIISIASVSEVNMDFTCDMYFRQSWKDPRLHFKPRAGISALFVGAEVANYIWNPDTFFGNEKAAQFHEVTTNNTFIRIKANGEVFRSTRLTVTSSCPMNLRYFPMDRQECTIEIESYGYDVKDIIYNWGIDGKAGVSVSSSVTLPQFSVKRYHNRSIIQYEASGNYSRLICEVELVRSLGYYLIQIYIPSSLIVIISWVSFWLHRNASPARVALGVTTVLTMTTLMSSTNAALPKISYVKSIDVFLGTCFVMVFAALLEYATVGYLGKRIALRAAKAAQLNKTINARAAAAAAAAASASATALPPDLQQANRVQPRPSCCSSEPLLGLHHHQHHQQHHLQQQQQQQPGRPVVVDRVAEATTAVQQQSSAPSRSADNVPLIPNSNTLFGVCPGDIDKYSRVVFPVCFLCFNLMYWTVYLHISNFLELDISQ